MNQILISEALYVTPEIRRKKLIYKVNFFVAIILMVLLFSYYAYSEISRVKEEQKAQDVLKSLVFSINGFEDSLINISSQRTTILLNKGHQLSDGNNSNRSASEEEAWRRAIAETTRTTDSGDKYYTIGKIEIPKINLKYAIVNKHTDEILKLSPTRFYGPDPNKIGNLCIVGHNYINGKFFTKVPTLEKGDIIKITDVTGKTIDYEIYDKYIVEPSNVTAINQETNNKREVTLITCTRGAKNRVIIKSREVER